MPIDDFTRAYFAMNKALEDASRGVGLGKRSAVVLLILSDAANGQKRTKEVVETFQKWFVSAMHTAAKDVSIAKGELFVKDLIVARHGIRNIALTEEGRGRTDELIAAIKRELGKLVTSQSDLLLIGQALAAIEPEKPKKALSSIVLPKKKPVESSRAKDKRNSA